MRLTTYFNYLNILYLPEFKWVVSWHRQSIIIIITIKCTYTRISIMAAHCKYDFNRESDIFTTEIGITHLTNLSTRIQLLLLINLIFKLFQPFVNFYKTFIL
jgi:hypothetical protein